MSRAGKAELEQWRNDYIGIKAQVKAADKDAPKVLATLRTTILKSEILELEKSEDKREFDRHKEREGIVDWIRDFRRDARRLKEDVRHYGNDQGFVDRLKRKAVELEERLAKFKGKQIEVYESLTNEEDELAHEIELFAGRIPTFEQPSELTVEAPTVGKKIVRAKTAERKKDEDEESDDMDEENEGEVMCVANAEEARVGKEIDELDRRMDRLKGKIREIDESFAENGGKNCGWTADDHASFLRLRTKHGNNVRKQAFLNDALVNFGYMNEDDVRAHIECHIKLTSLESQKRELLDEYARLKEEKKARQLQLLKKEEESKKSKGVEERKKTLTKEEAEERKKKLDDWKRRKLAGMEVEHEKKVKEELLQKKEREEKEKARRDALARQVNEYKETKEIAKIKEAEREEFKRAVERKPLAQQDLERLKQREDSLVRKRQDTLAQRQAKELEKKAREQKLAESRKHTFAYVNSKLDNPTKASASAKREKFDPRDGVPGRAETFGGVLLHGGSRGVPNWRQNM